MVYISDELDESEMVDVDSDDNGDIVVSRPWGSFTGGVEYLRMRSHIS